MPIILWDLTQWLEIKQKDTFINQHCKHFLKRSDHYFYRNSRKFRSCRVTLQTPLKSNHGRMKNICIIHQISIWQQSARSLKSKLNFETKMSSCERQGSFFMLVFGFGLSYRLWFKCLKAWIFTMDFTSFVTRVVIGFLLPTHVQLYKLV